MRINRLLKARFGIFFETKVAHTLILITVACTRVLWFSFGKIITSGDLVVPLSSLDFLKNRLYIWNEIDFGQFSVLLPRFISPLHLTLGTLNIFGVSNEWGQIIYTVLMYFLGSYAIYKLTEILSPKGNKTAALFASIFYLFNPLLINDGFQTSIMFLSGYVAFPCILYFYIQALNKKSLGHIIMTAVLMTFLASGMPSYRDLIIGIFLLGTYGIYYLFNTHNFKNWMINTGKILGLTFMINLFWLFPYLTKPERLLEKFKLLTLTPTLFDLTHRYTTLPNVFRGLGKWALFFGGIQGEPFFVYSPVYTENLVVIVATFLLPIIIFSSILLYRKREIFFMLYMALFFIFLSKGINPPFGELYSLIVNRIPFFKAVRESFFFLQGLMIPYSYLFGYSCQGFLHSILKVFSRKTIHNKAIKIACTVIILTSLLTPLLITSWPLVTGDIIKIGILPNWRGVAFPESYREISNILETDELDRVIVFPKNMKYVGYEWEYYGGRNILQYNLPTALVMAQSGDEYFPSNSIDFTQSLYQLAETKEYDLFASMLKASGVEFVLVETGIIYPSIMEEADEYVNDLANSPYFSTIREFEDVVLFRVVDSYPMVYAPSQVMTYHKSKSLPSNQLLIINNLSDGWKGPSLVDGKYNGTVTRLELTSNGKYTSCVKTIKLSSMGLNRGNYIVLPFSTSSNASFTLAIGRESETDKYLYAINSTLEQSQNTYSSDKFSPLIYRVYEDIPDAISIKLFASNSINKQSVGNLFFSFGSLSIVEDIGGLEDALERIEPDSSERFAFIDLDEDYERAIEVENIIGKEIPELTFSKIDQTNYLINVNSTDPFVLILSQTFDKEWEATIDAETINKHFIINGFANGWIIEQNGKFQISLEYSPQRDVEIGRIISILTIIFSLTMLYRKKIKHVIIYVLQRMTRNE